MSFFERIILGLALLSVTSPVIGEGVDHYELAPSVMRANGQAIYPSGVIDPALANPPGPSLENAIPMPPSPGVPYSTTPTGSPVGTPPMGPAVWSPSGPVSPSNSASSITAAGPSGSPAAVSPQIYPSPTAMPQIAPPSQASWYTRVEYFHWNERIAGTDFVNEDGALFTVGYSRRMGIERFRAELFGGAVNYQGFDQYQSTPTAATVNIPLSSNTNYLGLRGEYEMVLAPASWEGRAALLIGVGTRFWIRDFPDSFDDQGNFVPSIQETWWTIYPYIGLETHCRLGTELDIYSESRIGTTAVTYQFSSTDTNPLWPQPGIMANTEIGLRGSRFFIAGRIEVMSWSPSSLVYGENSGANQPNSVMFSAGGRMGFVF